MAKSFQKNRCLQQERLQRHWRQADVAEQLGTTELTVRRWEQGRQRPSAYYRLKLCVLFEKSAEELGLVEAEALLSPSAGEEEAKVERTPSSPGEDLALWIVPYARNPHFTGREALLMQLDQCLSPARLGDSTTTHRAALTQAQAIKGLGGIGKTQIAVEYAYRARSQGHYTHTLWINAASEDTIITSFVALSEHLPTFPAKEEMEQQKLVDTVKRWLEHCPQRWLLIMDNADDLSLAQNYLPKPGNGSLLITTRAHAVGAMAASIEVENMSLMEGTTLLLHRAQRQHADNEERNEAINVVMALDGFPLALDQAGAHIEETGCSFGEYLQLYHAHRYTLLARRGTQATNYPDSVATTWSLSFHKVEQANPAAAELLRLCAYLFPDRIPEELLKEGAAHWPVLLQQAVADSLSFNEMLEALLAFSLVKRLTKVRQLSLHRLAQVVQLDRMEPEEQHQWAERVVRAVNALFPADPKDQVEAWPQCLRYLEQVQACDRLIQQYRLLLPEAADLLDRAGVYLREHASYSLAESLFQRALVIAEQQLEPEYLHVASPLNNLGLLYHEQGKYELAEPLYQRALHLREQTLGQEHPQVASPLNNLGKLYHVQGKYELAEPLYQRALHIWEQASGRDHLHIVLPLDNLGLLYHEQGKYELAELLYQQALLVCEQALGPDHPGVARLLNNLGGLWYEQGKYELAVPLVQRALHIREQALGPHHPLVALCLNNLGDLWYEQGKYELAEPLYQRALHIWEQALGSDHSRAARPLNGLGNLAREQGKYEQADALYQRALSLRQEDLEPRHLEVAETLQDLARLQQMRQQPSEALSLYQDALAIRAQVLGAQHPRTAETRIAHAALLQGLARNRQGDERASLPQSSQTERVGNNVEADGEWRGSLLVLPPCPHCHNNTAVSKHGTNRSGTQRFRCQLCSCSFAIHIHQRGFDPSLKEQAVALKAQGHSHRSIARTLGVDHHTVRNWIQTVQAEQSGEHEDGT